MSVGVAEGAGHVPARCDKKCAIEVDAVDDRVGMVLQLFRLMEVEVYGVPGIGVTVRYGAYCDCKTSPSMYW